MKSWKAAALVAAGLIALAGCEKKTDVAAFETKAKSDVRAWLEAFNTGNVDAVVAFYAPDAVVMAPGNPAARGHDAIRALITKESETARSAGVGLYANDDDQAGASGDIGWHSGSFVVKDSTGAMVDSGNYMEVQQNSDGKWLIIRDIWNSDRPPPAPAEAPAADAAAEAPPAG
jgi:ketosteroid isomerase-like protein